MKANSLRKIKLVLYFLTSRMKKRTRVLLSLFLVFVLAGSGYGIYKAIRDYQLEAERKEKTQTVTLTAYVDVSKSNKNELFLLEEKNLWALTLEVPEQSFEEVKSLHYPLVKLSQTFVGEDLESEKFEVLSRENKEVPVFLEHQVQASAQIESRLQDERKKINSELEPLMAQTLEALTFDFESKGITVALNPFFAKENDVGQKVIVDIVAKHLAHLYEDKVLKTLWEKEHLSSPISYTLLKEEIAYGDFFGNVTKRE